MKAGKIVTPKGDNCHVERGGKRGKDAEPIFPTQPGYAAKDPLEDGKFPFQVDAAAERVWASYGRGWTDGNLKGKSGILFRPSRMAGDTYKLKLHIAIETKLVHDATSGGDVEKIVVDVTNDPPLPATPHLVLETDIFEVWSRVGQSRSTREEAGARRAAILACSDPRRAGARDSGETGGIERRAILVGQKNELFKMNGAGEIAPLSFKTKPTHPIVFLPGDRLDYLLTADPARGLRSESIHR